MQATTTSTFLVMIAIFGCLPTKSKAAEEVKLQLERFEQIGGEDIADASKLRVRKYNRTVFVLDGTLIMHKDLDSSYEVGFFKRNFWK